LPSSDDATRKLRSGSREPLLRVERLSVELAVKEGWLRRTVGQVRALDGVDLRVLRGQTLAVVGEPGAGKTTLARTIAGVVPPSSGKVFFEGKDVRTLGESERRGALRQIQLVTAETLKGADALTALVGLEPKLLIFDEAFEAFDAAARARLFEQLRRLQDERAFSCLLLTRSFALTSELADEILVLHAGQIVESGSTTSLVAQPHHPYTQYLLNSAPAAQPSLPSTAGGLERSEGCRFRARCPHAYLRCASEEPAFFGVPGGLSRCFLHDPDGSGQ
jgi:oligopeptide/dipeptide ABC transporter ATP-binding protein